VYRLATSESLSGFVGNTNDGVTIEVEGPRPRLDRFLVRFDNEKPPHAAILRRHVRPLPPRGDPDFVVAPSESRQSGPGTVLADLATCKACLREVFDPADRRYRYPFTTCVNCGPRYSIIEALPYDRARTTMRRFPLCAACEAEYTNPANRRFHAESIACADCGPRLALLNGAGTTIAVGDAALFEAIIALRAGHIVALKGLGGFQLLVDASNNIAVHRLRERKHRPRKPLAVMVPSLEAAADIAIINPVERDLLRSPEAPIVLLRARADRSTIAPAVAPDNPLLGVMLAYTPLHHLLLRDLGRPIVATSGNFSGDPIVADETEVLDRLGGIADLFLVHDRPIRRPVDDSVVRVMAGRPVVLRRARGYAAPLITAAITQPVLAVGGQQKSAIAAGEMGQLFLGAHIGDLDGPRARDAFARATAELPGLHGIRPVIAASDTHPDYHSTRVAAAIGPPVRRVPHHLAHVLSCMADNGLDAPVTGIAWDGTGHGADRTIWGGEIFTVDADHFRRVAHLHRFRLPGGEAAVREPRRAAFGALHAIGGDTSCLAAFTPDERAALTTMLDRDINAPLTSSAGRLFDAVAALLGLCQVASFEGEAAMAVEFASMRARRAAKLPIIDERETAGIMVLDWRPMLAALACSSETPEALALAFHNALSDAIVRIARRIGRPAVVLTGGCFQNALLTECAVDGLREAGFTPYWHRNVPPNDGGLAAGQAIFACRPLSEEKS
jgi:hydrogenase maturation protein HypF